MSTPQKSKPNSRPHRPLFVLSLLFLLLSSWSLIWHQTNAAPSAEPVTKPASNTAHQLFLPLVMHNPSSSTTEVTITPLPTGSATATNTATRTSTPTVTNTATSTPTATNTATPTSSPTVTNTATPTSTPTVTNTATPANTSTPIIGTGIFKQDGETAYHEDSQTYTGGCGFIRFADGSPAFGGENGFRAQFCMEGEGCRTSAPVDTTGYFEIPFADLRIEGEGYFQVLHGSEQEPVSDILGFNSEGQGSLVRMDFIECTQDDESEQCQFDPSAFAQSVPIAVEAASEPHRFCPSLPTATPTVTGTPPTATPTSTSTPSATPTSTSTPSATPTSTSTATPTSTSTPTVTATPLFGTGIFKQDGETVYHEDNEGYTGGCGFIRFFDGTPAFGGEDGFRARFCIDGEGCATSAPVDATGYFEVPFADLSIEGEGHFQVLQGTTPVSDILGFNSEGQGSLVRMDFIECTEGDESEQCQFEPPSFAQSSEETSAEGTSHFSHRFCPSAN